MARVLLTGFGAYRDWLENASWLALVELTRNLPLEPDITTRLYPVDLAAVRENLERDLPGHDVAIHLGQAPGSTSIQLEAIGINVAGAEIAHRGHPRPLAPDGPVAYQSDLPVASWAGLLRDAGIPAQVSYHAGTYLCNATLYLTHYLCEQYGWSTRAAFMHVPLAPAQAIHHAQQDHMAAMPSATVADALRLILMQLTD